MAVVRTLDAYSRPSLPLIPDEACHPCWVGFLQLFPECYELLFFLIKFSQSCINGGDITKIISAAILIRHELEAV